MGVHYDGSLYPFRYDRLTHIYLDTISMDCLFCILRGCRSNLQKLYFAVAEDCFLLANSAHSDEMPPYAAFLRVLHCLSKYLYAGIQN